MHRQPDLDANPGNRSLMTLSWFPVRRCYPFLGRHIELKKPKKRYKFSTSDGTQADALRILKDPG
jgi:hypothetical protein